MLGVVEMLRLVTDRGDAVVVNPPVYAPFYAFVSHDGRRVIEAPLDAEGRIDLDALEEAFARARARAGKDAKVAYLLCNPHNPTGSVHTVDELGAVAELARRFGVRVVSDEIHAPVVLPGSRFTPYLTVPGAENAFALTSASKAWNLSGLKAALAIAGPEAAADLHRMPEEVSHGPSHLGVIAHAEAFRTGGDWLDALLRGLDREPDAARRSGRRAPAGGEIPMAARDLPRRGSTAESSASRPRKPPTVLRWSPICPGPLAGSSTTPASRSAPATSSEPAGAGHVRLNFATSQAILAEADLAHGPGARRGR